LLAAAPFALLWLIASAVLLVMARQRVNEGIRELEDAAPPPLAVRGEGSEPLRNAHEEFSSARDLVRNPLIRPLTFVPFIGQQPTSAYRRRALGRAVGSDPLGVLEARRPRRRDEEAQRVEW
jgi:hypothetical protein